MKKVFRVSIHAVCLVLFTFHTAQVAGQTLFSLNSEFSYLKGKDAVDLSSTWYMPDFDASSWDRGNAPFWYGDGAGGTLITDMQNSYSTFYLRSEFPATNIDQYESLTLVVDFDDGFILWVNGENVFERFAPDNPVYNSFAVDLHESGSPEEFTLEVSRVPMREGMNQIAVQGFNFNLTSSDFHFNMGLSAKYAMKELSDSINVEFSHESGYYEEPFALRMDFDHAEADLYYTLDGSHPAISSSAIKFSRGDSILIDPQSTFGRGQTPAVVLRTALRLDGFEPSKALSRTFIFHDRVDTQDYPGHDWPDSDVNGQIIDYALDTLISRGTIYGARMEGALKDIPALSVITDNANLFDPSIGIYVNAFGHGPEWERESTIELIYPDSVAFTTNAGLRIRGGWSRHPNFPKHSFRLFFRSEYGSPKLYYPLFGNEGAERFDKIDLRTSQNYAWAQGDIHNTMLREVFSRDTQGAMGQAYTRSRYYHLYLNGMYWGLYQTQERSEARFAAEYFGGDPEDFDVIKVNTEDWNYRIEVTDGNMNLWEELYGLCGEGFKDMTNYYRVQGLDANGKEDRSLNKLVEIDNLIDYMITIFYTGNFDAPTSSFGRNKGANNFFAIKDRNDITTGFRFFNHDAEHSMFASAQSPGIGINENRVNIGTRSDDMRMEVTWMGAFHPQWLHFKLSENPEYRTRFSDLVFERFRLGGVMCEDSILARFNMRVDQIDKAIIAESARWGDGGQWKNTSYTRDEHWLPEVTRIRTQFIEKRSAIVLTQLRYAKLYSNKLGPFFYINSARYLQPALKFSDPEVVSIQNMNASGTLYYTLDGSDPRDIGGSVSASAFGSIHAVEIQTDSSMIITARVLDNGEWSPINILYCIDQQEDYSGLVITEIHYNPLDSVLMGDTIFSTKYEFIEFKNEGTHSISMAGVEIDSAVSYTFPEDAFIHPGGFSVIASSSRDFFERYGMLSNGEYKGNLSNGGELLLISNPQGNELFRFTYNDESPWPVMADGYGYSIVSGKAIPDLSPVLYEYWRQSANIGGSPFADDVNSVFVPDKQLLSAPYSIYPNPCAGYLTIQSALPDYSKQLAVDIFDMSGKMIFRTNTIPGVQMDLTAAGMKSGIYIIHLSGDGHSERFKLIFEEK